MKISVFTPTHDTRWLSDTWESLRRQTHHDFEWIIAPNNLALDDASFCKELGLKKPPGWKRDWGLPDDHRIVVAPFFGRGAGVGVVKKFACAQATGDVLLELDHDDMLTPTALEECAAAFEDSSVDFVYSECVDWSEKGEAVTYHDGERRAAWAKEGWRFAAGDVDRLGNVSAMLHPVCFEPSAASLRLIFYAPNHFRAWRRSFYERIGGHNAALEVCDDHELMIRTYLEGGMLKIPKVLYVYRVQGENTWLKNVGLIDTTTRELQGQYLHRLVAREMQLRRLPCLDLGGAHGSPGKPWIPVDETFDAEKTRGLFGTDAWTRAVQLHVDLNVGCKWPFPDSSVGAFRAVDLLEHLHDKTHTMKEIYRCLAPGGWLLSQTPSALGQGAFQDPTHVSHWVPNSFAYYTNDGLAKYLHKPDQFDPTHPRFTAARVFQTGSNPVKVEEIPYVVADLMSLKADDGSRPGFRGI